MVALSRQFHYTPRELRLYAVAAEAFAWRSGQFNMAELLDAMHKHGWRTLHRGPGNNRSKYRNKVESILKASPLFVHMGGDRYRINSWRRVVSHTFINRIPVQDGDLDSGQGFGDYLLLCCVHNRTVPVARICLETGLSRSQVYKGLKRLVAAGRIEKTHNLVISDEETTEEGAERARRELWFLGLRTEVIRRYPRPWTVTRSGKGAPAAYVVAYYTSNSYSEVAQGLEAYPQLSYKGSWFDAIEKPRSKYRVPRDATLWRFSKILGEAAYVSRYSILDAVA